MVNHYGQPPAAPDDAYTPGGKAGFRPDHTVTVYTRILKRLYPHVPVVVGGIEASLRRLAHPTLRRLAQALSAGRVRRRPADHGAGR